MGKQGSWGNSAGPARWWRALPSTLASSDDGSVRWRGATAFPLPRVSPPEGAALGRRFALRAAFLLSVSRALVRQAVGSDGCCATAACCSLLEHQDAAGGRGGDVGDGVSASFLARFPVRVGFWYSSRGWPVVGACNRT